MPLLNRIPAALVRTARTLVPGLAVDQSEPVPMPGGWEGYPPPARPGVFEHCANPNCESGWIKVWRSRRTPIFEGGWCCSPQCTRACVEAALHREMDGRGAAQESHRHRIPLGLSMLEQGWISAAQLREALEAQRSAGGGRLGQWLVCNRAVNEDLVTRALGLQWSCPVLGVEFHDAEGMTSLLPRFFADAFGALPLRVAAGKILYLGYEGHPDPVLALAVERMTGLRVESGLVPASLFRPAHARLLDAVYPRVELVEAVSESALAHSIVRTIERTQPVESRLVRVHRCLWLRVWLRGQRSPLPEPDLVEDLVGTSVGP
ncbi:MAG TPA: hypothetical protein VHX20_11100 [Terracidiphilus sp.]|jgi:hypothetical protein|nr:hypothetical protein [Terracidiphilus sp.]